MKQVYGPEAVS